MSGKASRRKRQLGKQVEKYAEGTGKPHTKTLKYDTLTYEPKDGEVIDVLSWCQWPSYDFIFGVPAGRNPYRKQEAAFFQYRDTRSKRVRSGFYVDENELFRLYQGFRKLWMHTKNKRKKAKP